METRTIDHEVIIGERRRGLEECAEVLLESRSNVESLTDAAERLYSMLSGAETLPRDAAPIRLRSGLAIAPADAGACVRDAVRSAMFLRAIIAAFRELAMRRGGQTIEIVYAGTGPFAALVVPLLSRISSGARFTFLDCHVASIASVRNVLEFFGYSSVAHQLIVGDATEYVHDREVDMLIVETMQRALTIEPQVAIGRHFAQQLRSDGVMVPERIEIDFAFVSDAVDVRVGRVMEVSLQTLRDGWPLRGELTMPSPPRGARPAFQTRIRTYCEHVIPEGASGLTQPEYVWDLADVRSGEEITFSYSMGASPRIRFERRQSTPERGVDAHATTYPANATVADPEGVVRKLESLRILSRAGSHGIPAIARALQRAASNATRSRFAFPQRRRSSTAPAPGAGLGEGSSPVH
jgi:hypothetical protein